MSAFDALEKRLLDLSLANVADQAERVVVVGLFTAAPAEGHNGTYGQSGEPLKGAYVRPKAIFTPHAPNDTNPNVQSTNSQPITITGLAPGTYTYFGVFGSSSAGTGAI